MTQTTPTLTLDAVRRLLLSAQGLLHPPEPASAKEDVLTAIRRMGLLQIDTIHVVARSPYLVLFSRLGDYNPRWLDELLAGRQLFEYWAHAACFLPIEDYPLYVSRMEKWNKYYYTPEWVQANQATIEQVLQRIRENGEVRSADFERTDGKKGSWWDWKIEKRVLEFLHTSGDLMIARRENFQRVYDLRERILPGGDSSPLLKDALSDEEAQDELAVRSVRVLGAAPARWVPDYFRLPKAGMAARLERLTAAGRLKTVALEGDSQPWYVHPETLSLLEYALLGELEPTYTTLLSPFDPLVSDRARTRELFDFDFSIECYLPQAKRRYGYFLLPILHAGRLVGRLDAKAYRKEGIFEVRGLFLEPDVRVDEELVTAVAGAIQRCAAWHAAPQVAIRKTEPDVFGDLLNQALGGQTVQLPSGEEFAPDDQYQDIQDVF